MLVDKITSHDQAHEIDQTNQTNRPEPRQARELLPGSQGEAC
jgi:hypothetical protein